MTPPSPQEVTQLLPAWGQGDKSALEQLIPLGQSELRRLARHCMRGETPCHLLQPTALVNETYLRLVDQRNVKWQNRAQFFGLSAQLMLAAAGTHKMRIL